MEYNLEDTPEYYIGEHKGIEAMDVVLDFQRNNYNIGTALTYLMRAGNKPDNPMKQDIIKAIVHLKKELDLIDYESNNISINNRHQESISYPYWYSTRTDKAREEQGHNREDKGHGE
jgi:hypothetical protein|tara:strand:- start:4106 stop:4456 length:351 start_codon:yes stop_codon:yes gene_type:complete